MDPTPDTNATTEPQAQAEAAPKPQYQAIACRKSQPDDAMQEPPRKGYGSPEDAAKRLKDMGYDTSDMEDHEDSYVFHQTAAPECKDAGEPDISDIEEGMKGIGCPKAAEVEPATTPEKNPYEQVPTAKGVKAADGSTSGNSSGNGERALNESGAGEQPKVPAGAQYVKGYCDLHDQGCGIHEEHKAMLENPPVREAAERWHEEDTARSEEMKDMLSELYPDVEFPDAAKDDEMADQTMQAKDAKDCGPDQTMSAKDEDEEEKDCGPDQAMSAKDDEDEEKDANPLATEETLADEPAEESLPGASYLAKVAGHIDAGQQMLNAGLKKQEHPTVKDFAAEELSRLEDRKKDCKDLMVEHYPEDAKKAFPEATVEAPASGDVPGASPPPETKADEDPAKNPDDKDKAKAKPPAKPTLAKAPPESNAELLRQMIHGLADLTKAVKEGAIQKAASPPPTPEPEAPAEISPETLAQLEALQAENATLQKQVADLVAHEKKMQAKLASKMGVNGKKKSACECGTCASCRTVNAKKNYFDGKTLGVADESAGGALVPTADTPEKTAEDEKTLYDAYAAALRAQGTEPLSYEAWLALPTADRPKAIKAKNYKLFATRNGQKQLLIPGTPTRWDMVDFRIEDEDGQIYENQIWQDRKPADEVLASLN